MNKTLKFFLITLFVLVDVLLVGFAIIYFVPNSRLNASFDVPLRDIPSYTSSIDISEGKRLFLSRGCTDCHSDNGSGKVFLEDPALGRYVGANLTAGKGGVGSSRSNGEYARAIRNGVGKDGKVLLFMPSTDFQAMSDSDVGKLVSYIKTLPPVDSELPKIEVGFLSKFLFLIGKMPLLVSAEQIDHSKVAVQEVKPSLSVEYGKYVAATCTGCHGMDLKGGPIQGAPPEWPPAQNIAGQAMAKWTEEQFLNSIRTGVRPDGTQIAFPMPWQSLKHLTDIELKAIRLYLLSLN